MRLNSLANKEVIDIDYGKKLGILGRADLDIDPVTGEIKTLIILNNSLMGASARNKELTIDWQQISLIGEDAILLRKPL